MRYESELSYKKSELPLMGVVYTVREMIQMITDDGWIYDSQDGDHRHYEHPSKPGKVTIPVGDKALAKKTAHSILRQAGLK
jgi:predicted RNA binding protein YcfA (HicA-like mRNA interferase family)